MLGPTRNTYIFSGIGMKKTSKMLYQTSRHVVEELYLLISYRTVYVPTPTEDRRACNQYYHTHTGVLRGLIDIVGALWEEAIGDIRSG
mmetsp:Transcript_19862/g.30069  ORF Transcript_19862/g.30069 Transcript_19862/m.30069 type:complete len:88 (+) Transcript_19862:2146-2409(+)